MDIPNELKYFEYALREYFLVFGIKEIEGPEDLQYTNCFGYTVYLEGSRFFVQVHKHFIQTIAPNDILPHLRQHKLMEKLRSLKSIRINPKSINET